MIDIRPESIRVTNGRAAAMNDAQLHSYARRIIIGTYYNNHRKIEAVVPREVDRHNRRVLVLGTLAVYERAYDRSPKTLLLSDRLTLADTHTDLLLRAADETRMYPPDDAFIGLSLASWQYSEQRALSTLVPVPGYTGPQPDTLQQTFVQVANGNYMYSDLMR